MVTAKLDEWGLGAWVALMVLGFFTWWPLGLVTLGFLIWSGRMGCWNHNGVARWQGKLERMQDKMDWMRGRMGNAAGTGRPGFRSSGNRAFDDYREETLRRLEEEQREFREFLERLRFAKDKTEFDQFMSERRSGTGAGPQSSHA